ncbi:MAG TPA: GNAT family N-acetyltransferase [Flavobacteriales bacterium]|nr:GNAT family N-acetyltransferase [Flavobacteriales bacterium]HRO39562.1 GNAT family N-acetyltransferase [Flavobacteriales bacterium]HRP81189.1 GNAT family N-acetyltransferase [Flavobacteriales bacterium]
MSKVRVQTWDVTQLNGMDALLLHDVLRLRVDVFVVEQQCAYAELDGLDAEATHVVGRTAEGGLVAYCRILPPQDGGLPHIGRVVVAAQHRGRGHGRELMHQALAAVRLHYGSARCEMAAQAHLQKFYEEFGFMVRGKAYLLDGIPHVDMVYAGPMDLQASVDHLGK